MNTQVRTMRYSDEFFTDGDVGPDSNASDHPVGSESRSRVNIREWNSYLPEDCVACMIEMGWDRTT